MVPIVVIVVGLALALYVFRKIRQFRSLQEFKGPWFAGWSRLWLLRANGSGKMNLVFTEVNDKYGKLASIAANTRHRLHVSIRIDSRPRLCYLTHFKQD